MWQLIYCYLKRVDAVFTNLFMCLFKAISGSRLRFMFYASSSLVKTTEGKELDTEGKAAYRRCGRPSGQINTGRCRLTPRPFSSFSVYAETGRHSILSRSGPSVFPAAPPPSNETTGHSTIFS